MTHTGDTAGDDTDHGGWDEKNAAKANFAGAIIRFIKICRLVKRLRMQTVIMLNKDYTFDA